jgi:hypothetical protein
LYQDDFLIFKKLHILKRGFGARFSINFVFLLASIAISRQHHNIFIVDKKTYETIQERKQGVKFGNV